MSWHKAALAPCLTWIGWSICVDTWTIQIPDSKIAIIVGQLDALLQDQPTQLKELQSALGRLLWLTSAWHYLRPLLIPLYRTLRNITVTMVGVNPMTFQRVTELVDDDLVLTSSLVSQHHSLTVGVCIKRVANTFITDRDGLKSATADAMACADFAGLGGAAFFADGSSVWFQFKITLAEAREVCTWVGDNMQRHIAAWELLAQFALTYCIAERLPHGHFPVVCHQGTDNSAADATSSKGISLTPGMSHILAQFFLFMRRHHVYAEITHIPGHMNTLADALSRFDETPVQLAMSSQVGINWMSLICQNGISVVQPDSKWPPTLQVRSA
eukprot:s1010_g33.t1